MTMTISKTIELARHYLHDGDFRGYARIMSSAIRSAMSDRAVTAYRTAIAVDGTERHFCDLDTSCPFDA